MTPRPYYGWVVLGAAFVIVTMAIGTLFSLAVFLRPLEESMGWARASVSAVAFMYWIARPGVKRPPPRLELVW